MKISPLLLSLLASGIALSGCGKISSSHTGKQASATAPSLPPQEVGVVTLKTQKVVLTTLLPGRTAPFQIAEVRPQVNGIIQKRLFEEGALVKEGQQLYQIDPAVYEANFKSAEASLARAIATEKSTRLLAERYELLVKSRAVSRQEYDDALASYQQAQADVAAAEAALESAQINLVYTKVLSPISGRTGRSSVTEGALATANQQQALVTVQRLDPLYVDVTQPSVILLRLQKELAEGKLKSLAPGQATVTLVLEDGSEYPHSGKLQFSEVTVDEGTGSVTLRVVVPNPDNLLLPGMFIHTKLEEGTVENAILAPQRAITRNHQGEATALIVNPEGKVEQRVLKTQRSISADWLVTEGLYAGDKVIVEGLQKVAPGAHVTTVEVQTRKDLPQLSEKK